MKEYKHIPKWDEIEVFMFKHEEINDEIAVFSSEYAVVIWWKQSTHSISSQKTIRKLQELHTLESQWLGEEVYTILLMEKREKK